MKSWYRYHESGRLLPIVKRQVFAALETELLFRLGIDLHVGFHSGSLEVSIPCLTLTVGYSTPLDLPRIREEERALWEEWRRYLDERRK